MSGLIQKNKEALFQRVHFDMNPSPARAFAFLILIQSLSGAVVLVFCPQFGISLSNHQINLVPHFLLHAESKYYCDLFCGGLFVSLTGALAFIFSHTGMKRSLVRHQFVFIVTLSFLFGIGFNAISKDANWLSLFIWGLGSSSVLLTQFLIAKYIVNQALPSSSKI